MKRNAIVRIILYSIAICILASCLAGGLAANSLGNLWALQGGQTMTDDPVRIDPDTVDRIEIQWVSGRINISGSSSSGITFEEEGATQEADRLVWSLSNRTLTIRYCTPRFFGTTPDKTLHLSFPPIWEGKELSIDNVSANISLTGVSVQRLDITNVSGRCSLNASAADIDIENVSGEVTLTGSAYRIDCETVSGKCTFKVRNGLKELDMDSVSGHCELYLPENVGFNAKLDSLSGRLSSEARGDLQEDLLTYGDGQCKIRCDSVSGDLRIRILKE